MRIGNIIWAAIMEDGTTYYQYEENKERSSEHIPRDKLRKFCLLTKNHKIIFVKELCPGWKFFYRRRTAMKQGGGIQIMHVVGWQIPTYDTYLTQTAFIYEEDMSIVVGDVISEESESILGKSFLWRYPIEFVPTDDVVIS